MNTNTKPRSVLSFLLLTFITCGIYMYYWIYATSKELSADLGEQSSAGMEVFLSIITCGIYTYYWCYKTAEKVSRFQANRGYKPNNCAVVCLLSAIFLSAYLSIAIIQHEINYVTDRED